MDNLDFQKFVDWAFMSVVSGGIGWSAIVLSRINKSIVTLNSQVAVILEKTGWHEKELDKHDRRITQLESK